MSYDEGYEKGPRQGGYPPDQPPAYETVYIQSQPKPAYPNQAMPPPYIACLPPAAPPSGNGSNAMYEFSPGKSIAYMPPAGFAPPPNSPPFPAPTADPDMLPAEVTVEFNNGDHVTTDVAGFAGEAMAAHATHLSLYNNDVCRIAGLGRFRTLMRLSLRNNDLTTLDGIQEAQNLRWIDVASNRLTNFRGMPQASYSLSFLDASDNDITSLRGLSYAPGLTWLNMFNNNLKSLDGIEGLPALRWIDASNCDLNSAGPLFQCRLLQEVNLANNDIGDVQSVLNLAGLPHLFNLCLYNNNFTPQDEATITAYFGQYNPRCFINFRSGQFGANNAHQVLDANYNEHKGGGKCVIA